MHKIFMHWMSILYKFQKHASAWLSSRNDIYILYNVGVVVEQITSILLFKDGVAQCIYTTSSVLGTWKGC